LKRKRIDYQKGLVWDIYRVFWVRRGLMWAQRLTSLRMSREMLRMQIGGYSSLIYPYYLSRRRLGSRCSNEISSESR
jgi:hypothetical protein